MEKLVQLINSYRDDLIHQTQQLVRIKSLEEEAKPGMPFGEGVNAALEYALALAEEMGFTTTNLEGYAGFAEMGEGEETIGILGHLDVVPEGEGWCYPPYGAEIHDGKIFGRGTMDDKGPVVAALFAMKALKESQLPINKRIRIIFGTNEETGMKDMEYYLKKEKNPDMGFTPDGDFPVIYGEKGIQVFSLIKKWPKGHNPSAGIMIKSIQGGTRPNVVPDKCKAVLKAPKEDIIRLEALLESFVAKTGYKLSMIQDHSAVTIISEGISAHGSTPEKGHNAISQLLLFLGELHDCSGGIFDFIKMYNRNIAMEYNGESIGCGFEDDISGKLIFNVGVIDADEKHVDVKINVRYPITSSGKDVLAGISDALKDTGIELVLDEDSKPLYVPQEHTLIQSLMKVYREETGDSDAVPITIGGGTYARAMENIVAFGPLFPGEEETAHQKNEFISIENLLHITHIYGKALYHLASVK
ncbi:succinyl-diaminopimelate desuccinylase [Natronincola peptidivorans]|uniref:Succinyl-diaminopimelate desuccinylase n=1 Tax=Natronincola peptidivorans TaxID=426128 RepID=A0A1H9ZY52_9FIRM|nr:dipeptidase PepV [Natronincola peptidivorans]SES86731.1 succinyl-diaminopimelate desuccinylase [Natronincola peptidivorans]